MIDYRVINKIVTFVDEFTTLNFLVLLSYNLRRQQDILSIIYSKKLIDVLVD